MRLTARKTLMALAAAVFTAGCGDSGLTTPTRAAAPTVTAEHQLLASPVNVNVMQRDEPLPAPVSTSVTVGMFGGAMSLPGTGLRVIIPPLAVTRTTTLTVTAPAGSAVAYEFGPHGTRFLVPLVVMQDLTHVNMSGVNPLQIFAGYYSSLDSGGGLASVTELLNTNVDVANLSAVFTVTHFSGYLLASGRCSSDQVQ